MERSNDLKEKELIFHEKKRRDEEAFEESLYHKECDDILNEWEKEDIQRENLNKTIKRSEKFYKKAKTLFLETLYNCPIENGTMLETIKKNIEEDVFNIVSKDDIINLEYYLSQINVDVFSEKYDEKTVDILEFNIEEMKKGLIIANKICKF
jgi:hypothetical protein